MRSRKHKRVVEKKKNQKRARKIYRKITQILYSQDSLVQEGEEEKKKKEKKRGGRVPFRY